MSPQLFIAIGTWFFWPALAVLAAVGFMATRDHFERKRCGRVRSDEERLDDLIARIEARERAEAKRREIAELEALVEMPSYKRRETA